MIGPRRIISRLRVQVSSPRVMAGTLDLTHEYRDDGDYKVKAWLYLPGESPRMATATVRISDNR